MTGNQVSRSLLAAEDQLSGAIQAIATLTQPSAQWNDKLEKAANLLDGVDPGSLLAKDRDSTLELLGKLNDRAVLATRLLDSAATLYFGGVLSQGLVDSEYLASGADRSFGGGCLHIDG